MKQTPIRDQATNVNSLFSLDRIESSFSSIYHCWLFYRAEEISGTLIEVLAEKLPHINPEEIPARLAWGGVFVNGIEVNIEQPLPVPCKLEYYEPRFLINEADKFFPQFSTDLIIYEDDYLIALYKPAKLPTNPGKEQKYFNVRAYVEKYTGLSPHLPSRLDMSTSGIILVSKNTETHKPLQRLYEKGAVKKTYILAIHGECPWEQYDHQGAIGNDLRHAVLRKVVESGGKPSRTLFTKLKTISHPEIGESATYIQAAPQTGRTHQIRVHISNLGYPIIGDNFYGGLHSAHLNLMAYSLSFRHPKGGKEIQLSVPPQLFPTWLDPKVVTNS